MQRPSFALDSTSGRYSTLCCCGAQTSHGGSSCCGVTTWKGKSPRQVTCNPAFRSPIRRSMVLGDCASMEGERLLTKSSSCFARRTSLYLARAVRIWEISKVVEDFLRRQKVLRSTSADAVGSISNSLPRDWLVASVLVCLLRVRERNPMLPRHLRCILARRLLITRKVQMP